MLGTNWFECKVSAEKAVEGGMSKKFNESYLVDALNFTDAEARITKEVAPFCNGEDADRKAYSQLHVGPGSQLPRGVGAFRGGYERYFGRLRDCLDSGNVAARCIPL